MNGYPLVILVVDAGDVTLLDRWLPEGRLPTIAGLIEGGCFARTTGGETVTEHGTRLSLWSGMPRSQHGYYYFRQLVPGTYNLEPWSARNASARPFWSRLRDRRIAVVDAPEAFPLPGLTGIQLGDWTTLMPDVARFPASSEPPGLVAEVEHLFGPRVELREFRPHQSIEEDRALYTTMQDRLPRYGDLLRKLLVRERYDLIVAGFYEAHAAAHQFWKYRDREDAPPGLANAVRDTYEAVDRELGLLLDQLPGSNVVVLSGMGMKSDYPVTGLIEAFCQRLGYQTPVAGGGGVDARSLARRVLPESWRVAISQRLPREAQERALENQFRNATDWSRTTAFSIPTLYGAFLRVNLRGREPQGVVDAADYEPVLAQLEGDLAQLVDPRTGGPAVQATVRAIDLYDGGPPESLPDLFVEMEPADHFLAELAHPRARLTQPPPAYFRDSHHSPVGWLAAAGQSVAATGELAPIDVLDLAPTFLALLGEPVPQELPGAPLGGLLAD